MSSFVQYQEKAVFMEKELLDMGKVKIPAGQKLLEFFLDKAGDIFSTALGAPSIISSIEQLPSRLEKLGATAQDVVSSKIQSLKSVCDPKEIDKLVLHYAEKRAEDFDGLADASLAALGMFDSDKLRQRLDENEKQQLKLNGHLFKAIGKAGWLLIGGAALGALNPVTGILAGVILVSSALSFMIKSDRLAKSRRWEEIVASMMTKYKTILENAEMKKVKAQQWAVAVEDQRFKYEQALENATNKKSVVEFTHQSKAYAVTANDLDRLGVYCEWGLGRVIKATKNNRYRRAYLYVCWKSSIRSFYGASVGDYHISDSRKERRQKEVTSVNGATADYTLSGNTDPPKLVFSLPPESKDMLDDEVIQEMGINAVPTFHTKPGLSAKK